MRKRKALRPVENYRDNVCARVSVCVHVCVYTCVCKCVCVCANVLENTFPPSPQGSLVCEGE